MRMNNEHKIVCGILRIRFYGLKVLKKMNWLSKRQWIEGDSFLLPIVIIDRKGPCQSKMEVNWPKYIGHHSYECRKTLCFVTSILNCISASLNGAWQMRLYIAGFDTSNSI